MPLFLLDTDICSYIIRERPPSLKERLAAVPIEQQCISAVTYAELVYGVRRSSSQRVNQAVIDAFVSHLDVLDWTKAAADHYGEIRAVLEAKGCPIGNMDMMIAAHARSLDATVVTNNLKHPASLQAQLGALEVISSTPKLPLGILAGVDRLAPRPCRDKPMRGAMVSVSASLASSARRPVHASFHRRLSYFDRGIDSPWIRPLPS